MVKYLNKMADLKGDSKKIRTKFSKAYNKFGKALMSTPFAFQAALNITKGQGSDVYFSLETTETKKHEAILQFNSI